MATVDPKLRAAVVPYIYTYMHIYIYIYNVQRCYKVIKDRRFWLDRGSWNRGALPWKPGGPLDPISSPTRILFEDLYGFRIFTFFENNVLFMKAVFEKYRKNDYSRPREAGSPRRRFALKGGSFQKT